MFLHHHQADHIVTDYVLQTIAYCRSNPTIFLRIGTYFSTHAFQTVTDSYARCAFDSYYVNARQSTCKLLHEIR